MVTIMSNPNVFHQLKADLSAFCFVVGKLEMNVIYFLHVSLLNFMMHSISGLTQNTQTVFSNGSCSDVQ